MAEVLVVVVVIVVEVVVVVGVLVISDVVVKAIVGVLSEFDSVAGNCPNTPENRM